jgi:hypothetical protein
VIPSGDQAYVRAIDRELGATLKEGQQQFHPVALVALCQDYAGKSLHGTGDDFDRVTQLNRWLEGHDAVSLRRPRLQFRNQGITHDCRRGSGRNHVRHLGGVPDGAVAQGRIKPAKKIAGKKRAYDSPALAPDGTLLAQAGKVSLKAELLAQVRRDLSFFLRLRMETVPVHEGFGEAIRLDRKGEGRKNEQAAAIAVRERPPEVSIQFERYGN